MVTRKNVYDAGFGFYFLFVIFLLTAFGLKGWASDKLPDGKKWSFALWKYCYPDGHHVLISSSRVADSPQTGPPPPISPPSSSEEDSMGSSKEKQLSRSISVKTYKKEPITVCVLYFFNFTKSAASILTRAAFTIAITISLNAIYVPCCKRKLLPFLQLTVAAFLTAGSVLFHFAKKDFENEHSVSLQYGTPAYMMWVSCGVVAFLSGLSFFSSREPPTQPTSDNQDTEAPSRANVTLSTQAATTVGTSARTQISRTANKQNTRNNQFELQPGTGRAGAGTSNTRTDNPDTERRRNNLEERCSRSVHIFTLHGNIYSSDPTFEGLGSSGSRQETELPRYEEIRQETELPGYEEIFPPPPTYETATSGLY